MNRNHALANAAKKNGVLWYTGVIKGVEGFVTEWQGREGGNYKSNERIRHNKKEESNAAEGNTKNEQGQEILSGKHA